MYFCAPGVGKGLSVKKQLSKGKSFSNPLSAVDKVVAQVSNLLYRRASSLPAIRTISRARTFGWSADWKSAIQQVGNLRYADWPDFVPMAQRRLTCTRAGVSMGCETHQQPRATRALG